jgi:iron complex transport system substrate-binding protein
MSTPFARRPAGLALAALVALVAALASAATAGAATAPRRIVALTPFTANTLATLNVKPVAIGQTVGGNDRFKRALKGVKKLPLSHPLGPNLEQLAVLNPQLVLSAPIWRKGSQGMEELGMRVVESDPQRVSEVPQQIEFIGKLVGRSAQAKKVAALQRKNIAVATRKARRHPRVLLVLGIGQSALAFLPNSWGGDLVTQAGGRLITAGLSGAGGFARISNEAIIQQNPDVIIAVPHGNPQDIDAVARSLRIRPEWSRTKAARNGRVYVLTDNSMLQSYLSVASTIRTLQTKYLRNR